jgi:plasmid maintenance system antidote protein VapI
MGISPPLVWNPGGIYSNRPDCAIESAVTPDMALRFRKCVSGAPELHVNMQASDDLCHAPRTDATPLKKLS